MTHTCRISFCSEVRYGGSNDYKKDPALDEAKIIKFALDGVKHVWSLPMDPLSESLWTSK